MAGGARACYGAIVLAAGSSSRMGAHKLLLPLGGRALVSYAVEAACASAAHPVIVVLGRAADDMRAALPAGRYRTVVNLDYAAGMAGSLRVGLRALREADGDTITGALIALADQPLAGADLFYALLLAAAKAPESIVAASYSGRRGNPVVFPAALFGELERVEGDEGGRGVIARHPELLRLVEWPDASAALDVDRPGDYERVVSLLTGGSSST
jgi:molybdenum cofactor cytidylyltransferase